MHKLKKLMELIRKRDFKQIWQKGIAFLPSIFYKLTAILRDKRYGGRSVNGTIPTRYRSLGAFSTQSSDYRCMRRVFREVPLLPDDLFVDVGCGEGRVLTYLYSKGFRGNAVGIELDEDVAKTAEQRTSGLENVTIICGNILDQGLLLQNATAVYLFNPFSERILSSFVDLLESVCTEPVRLYYLNCFFVKVLQDRDRWKCISSGDIRRPGFVPMQFAVYQLINLQTNNLQTD